MAASARVSGSSRVVRLASSVVNVGMATSTGYVLFLF